MNCLSVFDHWGLELKGLNLIRCHYKHMIRFDDNNSIRNKDATENLLLLNPFVPNASFLLPPENIRKPSGILMFSGGRESVQWEKMD